MAPDPASADTVSAVGEQSGAWTAETGSVVVRADLGAVGGLAVEGAGPTDDRRVDEDARGSGVGAGDAEVRTGGVDAAARVVAIVVGAVADALVWSVGSVGRSEVDLGELQAAINAAMLTNPIVTTAPRRRCRAGTPSDRPRCLDPAGIS